MKYAQEQLKLALVEIEKALAAQTHEPKFRHAKMAEAAIKAALVALRL